MARLAHWKVTLPLVTPHLSIFSFLRQLLPFSLSPMFLVFTARARTRAFPPTSHYFPFPFIPLIVRSLGWKTIEKEVTSRAFSLLFFSPFSIAFVCMPCSKSDLWISLLPRIFRCLSTKNKGTEIGLRPNRIHQAWRTVNLGSLATRIERTPHEIGLR